MLRDLKCHPPARFRVGIQKVYGVLSMGTWDNSQMAQITLILLLKELDDKSYNTDRGSVE